MQLKKSHTSSRRKIRRTGSRVCGATARFSPAVSQRRNQIGEGGLTSSEAPPNQLRRGWVIRPLVAISGGQGPRHRAPVLSSRKFYEKRFEKCFSNTYCLRRFFAQHSVRCALLWLRLLRLFLCETKNFFFGNCKTNFCGNRFLFCSC